MERLRPAGDDRWALRVRVPRLEREQAQAPTIAGDDVSTLRPRPEPSPDEVVNDGSKAHDRFHQSPCVAISDRSRRGHRRVRRGRSANRLASPREMVRRESTEANVHMQISVSERRCASPAYGDQKAPTMRSTVIRKVVQTCVPHSS